MSETVIRLILAVGINAVLALSARFARLVSTSGTIGGFVLGALIYFFTDWRGYIVLVSFFVFGTLVTKVKYSEKSEKGIAQEDEGRRGAKHVFANCLASLLLGLGAWLAIRSGSPEAGTLLMIGYTGAFATALSDTSSSEIGQAYGKTTILLTSFRRVPPGTEGAVSLEGTLAGIAGSLVLALVALACGIAGGFAGIVSIVLAAFIGNTLESIIGSTIEKLPFITNEVTNFINTVIGALAAMGIFLLIT